MDLTRKLTDTILFSILSYLIQLPFILPPSAGDPGLVLLVVCRRWRYIILHSANQWSKMVVSPTVSSNRFNANVEFDRCWLNVDIQRHSGHWLDIFLLHVPKAPPSPQNSDTGNTCSDEISILENIVLPPAKRAKCLSLPFCSNRAAEIFLTAPAGQFYFLESVEISFLKCGQYEVAGTEESRMKCSKPITVFQNVPFLHRVSIITHNGLNPLTLLLPWHQLTTINMGFTTIHLKVFRTILSKSSPSLSTGFFTVKFSPKKRSPSTLYINQNPTPRIVAPALKHLHLRLIDPSLDCDIFTRIRLPALISFRVDLHDCNAGWMMNIYQPLLCSSSSTLEMLTFLDLQGFGCAHGLAVHLDGPRRNTPQIQQDLQSLFSILPMVRVLRLPFGLYIPKAAMELISLGKLLPQLETLKVASSTGVDILTMVNDRNEVAYLLSEPVGSSSAAPSTCDVPSHFSEVVLWTSTPQEPSVTSCVASIQSLSSSQKTKFRIFYADQMQRGPRFRMYRGVCI